MSLHSLLHTSEHPAADTALGNEPQETVAKPPLRVGEVADCCCAAAQVRLVLPPVAGRKSRPELLLCAHHYREAAPALAASGADAYDAAGHLLTGVTPYWASTESRRLPDASSSTTLQDSLFRETH